MKANFVRISDPVLMNKIDAILKSKEIWEANEKTERELEKRINKLLPYGQEILCLMVLGENGKIIVDFILVETKKNIINWLKWLFR